MNLGIIVEGDDDVAVYPVLIRRLDDSVEYVYSRGCGGLSKLKGKFVSFVKEFQRNPNAFRIRKILVIRDSDCNDPGPLEAELQNTLARSGAPKGIDVSFHATKCKLESWLLADENAINLVSQKRGGPGGLAPIPGTLETVRNADDVYSKVLSEVGLQNTGEVMKEIAEKADLATIRGRCPRFRDFAAKVVDP